LRDVKNGKLSANEIQAILGRRGASGKWLLKDVDSILNDQFNINPNDKTIFRDYFNRKDIRKILIGPDSRMMMTRLKDYDGMIQ
jgi:hypothetical protein